MVKWIFFFFFFTIVSLFACQLKKMSKIRLLKDYQRSQELCVLNVFVYWPRHDPDRREVALTAEKGLSPQGRGLDRREVALTVEKGL